MEIAMVLDNALFRLKIPRAYAARELHAQMKIGQAIRGQRIRDMRDLEEARREKQEWIQRTLELLGTLVNSDEWAEQFNDYVPTILPEYAEFDMFVDVFEEEMKHRLGRLNGLIKALPSIPEPPPLQPVPAAQPPEPPATPQRSPTATAAPQPARRAHPEIDEPQIPPAMEEIMTTVTQPASSSLTNPLLEPDSPRMPAATSAVHGALIIRAPDDALRTGIAQFMQKMNIALHLIDRHNPGPQSMIELLAAQKHLNFAMVLVDGANGTGSSPDDMFDLGCCVGRLGPGRVYALHRGGEATADRHGIGHIPVDGTEGWQLSLARQLKKSGVPVDLNKLV